MNISILECAVPLVKDRAKHKLIIGDRCTGKTWNSVVALAALVSGGKINQVLYTGGHYKFLNIVDILEHCKLLYNFVVTKSGRIKDKVNNGVIEPYKGHNVIFNKPLLFIDDAEKMSFRDIDNIINKILHDTELWVVNGDGYYWKKRVHNSNDCICVYFNNNKFTNNIGVC